MRGSTGDAHARRCWGGGDQPKAGDQFHVGDIIRARGFCPQVLKVKGFKETKAKGFCTCDSKDNSYNVLFKPTPKSLQAVKLECKADAGCSGFSWAPSMGYDIVAAKEGKYTNKGKCGYGPPKAGGTTPRTNYRCFAKEIEEPVRQLLVKASNAYGSTTFRGHVHKNALLNEEDSCNSKQVALEAAKPWIEFDLGKEFRIEKVSGIDVPNIMQHVNYGYAGFKQGTHKIFVCKGKGSQQGNSCTPCQGALVKGRNNYYDRMCGDKLRGRYVRLEFKEHKVNNVAQRIHFCRVKVFGAPV